MKKRGFTLIELLVVIAIIALLMSILMPALSRVKKQASLVVCKSRMKQWGVVLQMYTGDNDGFFLARQNGTNWGYARMWPYTYKKLYNDPKMRFCSTAENPAVITGPFATWNYTVGGSYDPMSDPSLMMTDESTFDARTGTVRQGFFTGSLGFNRYIENVTGGTTGTDPTYWRKADAAGGDRIPVVVDCMYLYFFPTNAATPPAYNGDYSLPEMHFASMDRHLGYNNVCFLDFSARSVGLKELWTMKWANTNTANSAGDTCGMWTICGFGGGNAGKTACETAWNDAAIWMKAMPVY
jgi:prepilin-type N-terminal cleavage/methylation domain-containing protein